VGRMGQKCGGTKAARSLNKWPRQKKSIRRVKKTEANLEFFFGQHFASEKFNLDLKHEVQYKYRYGTGTTGIKP
jgi:hypothetical protein